MTDAIFEGREQPLSLREEAVRLHGLVEQLRSGPAPSELLVHSCLEGARWLATSARALGLKALGEAASTLEVALELHANGGAEAERVVSEAGSRLSLLVHGPA